MENFPIGGNAAYGGPAQEALVGRLGIAPTMKQRLAGAVQQAEERLQNAKRAKEILDKHPELEELLNIMQKGHF